jgi:hypothetical protein
MVCFLQAIFVFFGIFILQRVQGKIFFLDNAKAACEYIFQAVFSFGFGRLCVYWPVMIEAYWIGCYHSPVLIRL